MLIQNANTDENVQENVLEVGKIPEKSEKSKLSIFNNEILLNCLESFDSGCTSTEQNSSVGSGSVRALSVVLENSGVSNARALSVSLDYTHPSPSMEIIPSALISTLTSTSISTSNSLPTTNSIPTLNPTTEPTPSTSSLPTPGPGSEINSNSGSGSGSGIATPTPLPTPLPSTLPTPPPALKSQLQQSQQYEMTQGLDERGCLPKGIILAPTRELVCQINVEAKKLCYNSNIKSVVIYGGTDVRTQLLELSTGCDLIVATPGRLFDLVERGCISFCEVVFLILDEADRMLDMGFEVRRKNNETFCSFLDFALLNSLSVFSMLCIGVCCVLFRCIMVCGVRDFVRPIHFIASPFFLLSSTLICSSVPPSVTSTYYAISHRTALHNFYL